MRSVLKNARENKDMTQQATANYLGVTLRQYQRIEAGTTQGTLKCWDALEDLFSINQRELRQLAPKGNQ